MEQLNKIIEKGKNTEQIPKDWNKAIITPIKKKGNKTERSNYRGISLLGGIYKEEPH